MKRTKFNSLKRALAGLSVSLCCGTAVPGQANGQPNPPPAGAGIVAAVQANQDIYTNIAPSFWCPPCVTSTPPCLLPCYLIEGQTAGALFAFTVANDYKLPRTFEFSSGQQFDVELIDQIGRVVAAWSDGKVFTQALTSFTLGPGEAQTFWAKMALKDRNGWQLNGPYWVRAFLTTSGPLPRVEAATQILVILASPP
ncbi:MAG TPA: BsuPI-related putative proteinase inhibitor [Verrucomicrobiae bacterium]|jgi:hypothetical protein